MKDETSEFGRGFIYNLVLFAKHWCMMREDMEKMKDILGREPWDLWFNGASDHFYDLVIPEKWTNTEIGKKASWLKERSLYLGHGFQEKATRQDFEEAFKVLQELCLLIDKELGVEPIEAEWD